MIDRQSFFAQPNKNDLRTYNNIRKIATGQGDDYATGCSLDYLYFNEYCKLNARDLSKQQALLDVNRKTIQQINFTGNLDRSGNTIMLFR